MRRWPAVALLLPLLLASCGGSHTEIEYDRAKTLDALPEPEQVTQATTGEDDEDVSLAGVTVRPLTNRLRAQANLPEDLEGLLVMSVEATSNAAGAGLARGDVIQEVDRSEVTSLDDFQGAIAQDSDRPIFMRVFKPQQRRSVFIAVPR